MAPRINKRDPVILAIMNYSDYKHSKYKNSISGSSYGSAVRQFWLNKRHGSKVTPRDILKNVPLVTGTAMHTLLEYSDTEKYLQEADSPYTLFGKEEQMHYHTPSGITLTGTFDMMLQNKETEELQLWDMKTMKSRTGKNFQDYENQMSIYAWIAERFYNMKVEVEGRVLAFDKEKQEFSVHKIHLHHRSKSFDPITYTDLIAFHENTPDEQLPECNAEQRAKLNNCIWCQVRDYCSQTNPFSSSGFTAE